MLQEALYSFISVVLVDSNDQFSESQHDVKLIIDLSADRRYMFIKLKFAVNFQAKNVDWVFNRKEESIIGVSDDQSLMFTLVDNHLIFIIPLIYCFYFLT